MGKKAADQKYTFRIGTVIVLVYSDKCPVVRSIELANILLGL